MNSEEIITWFKKEGISYPWGRDKTPYRVWISEIMLQQTVVTAVIPYFERWMEHFPSLEILAGAGEGDVLRLWEGLGYYSRARNIHKTARIIYERGNVFPSTYEDLILLPGIGDYTACAILSISYQRVIPVMDANVRRICQRIACQREWTKQTERDWKKSLTLIMDRNEPGTFNCALMQLGQILCRRSRPACEKCPLCHECGALKEGMTEEIPPVTRKEIIERESLVLIFRRKETRRTLYWIIQRSGGIGKGLWSFPRIPDKKELPLGWIIKKELTRQNHLYTKYREKLIPLVCEEKKGSPPGGGLLPGINSAEGEGFWAAAGELTHLAVPAVYRKIINELISLPESG